MQAADPAFSIAPDGPFSLAAAAGFGFGPNTGRPMPVGGEMRLAFVADDFRHHEAVHLRQDEEGTVRVSSAAPIVNQEALRRQVARILSLDHSGQDWLAVGVRDSVIGKLQAELPGLRPVLFHSPYEAAAWSIITARRRRTQATLVRTRLAAAAGRTFTIAGEEVHAFPLPERLLEIDSFPGIDATRIQRLHGVARAALDGALEPAFLLSLEPAKALEHLQKLPGIGPTYSTLILLRATGATDVMTFNEPRLPSYAAHFYDVGHPVASREELLSLSDRWQPFRTWAAVLIRVAGDRAGIPVETGPTANRPRLRASRP